MGGHSWGEHEPTLFVIVSTCPEHEITVPAASARAAQQAARYLLEHYSHTRTTWHVNRHAAFGPVVVFGCRRPLAGEHLLDQQAHAFTLAAGAPLPAVWAALCGHWVGPRCSRSLTTAWADRARRASSAGLRTAWLGGRIRYGGAADDH